MIIVRIVQFVKIVQLVQLDYYGYIKFFGGFIGTWIGAFTIISTILSASMSDVIIFSLKTDEKSFSLHKQSQTRAI